MAPPKGNTYAKKFKTQEERAALCDLWCEHLIAGYTEDCFPHCDVKTVHRVMADHPEDFPADRVVAAKQAKIFRWQQRLAHTADTGEGSATASIFALKNVGGWRDKSETEISGTTIHEIRRVIVDPARGDEDA